MRNSILFLFIFIISGCSVFDRISSGDRRIPLSQYAYDEFTGQSLSDIRVVYEKDRKDIFTYIVGFDGTNNSDDCDLAIGSEPSLIDSMTNKPSCTTVRRLKGEVPDIAFDADFAPRVMKYYHGPGAPLGRFTNPIDSLFGYTSRDISERALAAFLKDVQDLPPNIKEVRLLAIGFSRGSAIARDFINKAHASWPNTPQAQGIDMWSTLLLYDTVATFQQEKLQLAINPRSEQVIHLMSKNESRIEFRPIIDKSVAMAADSHRLIVMKLPGAHADVGVGYRFGANVFSDYLAHRIAQEMGLIAHVSKAYSQQPLYGLVDSRGWRDKLAGTPSGYACGFERQAQKEIAFFLSPEELAAYRNRLTTRGVLHLDQISSDYSLNLTQPFVIRASSTQTEWDVVPVNIGGLSNYETRVNLSKNENGASKLIFLDGNNKGREITLPDEVLNEIQYYRGKIVQLEITGLNDPASGKTVPGIWFFVNGCLPTDGRLH